MINSDRAAHGLRALQISGTLTGIAQRWAAHMAATDNLSHNSSAGAEIPSGWSTWGENVGYSTLTSASNLNSAFMASPDHRANILSTAYTEVGVGYATKNGHTYVSELFAGYPSASAAPAPKAAAPNKAAPKAAAPNNAAKKAAQKAPAPNEEAPSESAAPPQHASAPHAASSNRPSDRSDVSAAASTDGVLRLGSYGALVTAAQRELRTHGQDVSVDGRFGPGTESAVRSFQCATGLTVDGLIGPRTHAALVAPAPPRPASKPASKSDAAAPSARKPRARSKPRRAVKHSQPKPSGASVQLAAETPSGRPDRRAVVDMSATAPEAATGPAATFSDGTAAASVSNPAGQVSAADRVALALIALLGGSVVTAALARVRAAR
jgi:hypothetical protein